MSLHGVKRTRPTAPDDAAVVAAARAKEQHKIEEYLALTSQLTAIRSEKAWDDPQLLELTAAILHINADHPTAWSCRRRALLRRLSRLPVPAPDAAHDAVLDPDLALTEQSLGRNPKAYPIWEHRKWVLRTLRQANWKVELKTVEALLQKDGRNFHAWGYRRYLVSHLTSPAALSLPPSPLRPRPTPASELSFTTAHIRRSFSNFSAWHHRSRLLGAQFGGMDRAERRGKAEEELEMVLQALYVDPDDQSAWLYHRWLLSQVEDAGLLKAQVTAISELLELEPESRLALLALIHYETRLAASIPQGVEEAQQEKERAATKQRCRERLERLQALDVLRKERYADLARAL